MLDVVPQRALRPSIPRWKFGSTPHLLVSNTAGVSLELYHEVEGFVTALTTAANGSAWTTVDVGDALVPQQRNWIMPAMVWSPKRETRLEPPQTLDEYLVGLDVLPMRKRPSS